GTTLPAATFTLNASPLITATGLNYISGNNQSIAIGGTSNPLTVQLNGSNGTDIVPIPGATIQWSITGPGTLSGTTGTTGTNGQASVTVTAGSVTVPTAVTVVAKYS